MKITKEWLKEKGACSDSYKEFEGESMDGIEAIKKCIKINRVDWANWLIVRIMEYKQYTSYAVFAAEQVLPIYEKKYPADKRPRETIEAARECIDNPTEENKKAAYAAAAAAYDAYATAAAAAAAYDADAAAAAAADAADARESLQAKIIAYGIELLEKGK